MKKILTTTLGMMMLSAASFAPALADDSSPVKNVAMLPVRAVGLCASTAIGTPVAAVRMSAHNTMAMCNDIGGDSMPKKAMASVIALPYGVVKGTVQGCYYGPHNAIKNCVEHPFSKESMSLADLQGD